MATFNDIQRANETMSTITIERKDKKTGRMTSREYAEVNQRIKAFRMVYPEGTIETEMLSNVDGVCIFKATAKNIDIVLGTGHAYEKETSSFINQTSYIENCETSAIGRCLAACGFGIDTSVASYEEVANAMKNQEVKAGDVAKSLIKEDRATKEEVQYIVENTTPEQLQKLLKQKKVDLIEDLPEPVAFKICQQLRERMVGNV